MKPTISLLLLVAAAAGCADEFDPYEDVRTPRLLAIAADPPTVAPGDSVAFSTLVTEAGATHRWSWCPLVGSGAEGYPCLVEQAQVQAAVDQALGPGQVTVPDFDLGTGDTASLEHAIPPEVWIGLCEALSDGALPPGIPLPACEDGFDVAVRVDVTMGQTVITGTRELRLLFDGAVGVNRAPVATGLVAIHPDTGAEIAIADAGTATLERGVEYGLRLDLADDQAETVGSEVEKLRISWFHQGGEIDRSATGSNATTTLAEARENDWLTPLAEDWPETTARLFLVVRDDRGGTSWLLRSVELSQ